MQVVNCLKKREGVYLIRVYKKERGKVYEKNDKKNAGCIARNDYSIVK